ncbi:hypothetical protein DRH27_01980 [Candidatus Falkowbacteria bacterium]|nr:MAG: hypothetical protein DRH27_01980 [Candidatus Falkowbacteria bacterium]
MKLAIDKNKLSGQAEQFLRQAGYGFIVDRQSGQESFVRRLSRDHYPRLHMYVKEVGEKVEFNLHLDQKKASYPGAHAHSAEYNGAVVEEEIERLKGLISHNTQHITHNSKHETPKEKSFFKKLFG